MSMDCGIRIKSIMQSNHGQPDVDGRTSGETTMLYGHRRCLEA